NELEVSFHVEAIPSRDLVLRQRLLGDLVVLRVDLLVAARSEAPLRRPEDHLAARAALTGVGALHLRVLRAHLGVGRSALQLGVAPLAPAPARRPLPLAAVTAALTARSAREHQELLAVGAEHPRLSPLSPALIAPLPLLALAALTLLLLPLALPLLPL